MLWFLLYNSHKPFHSFTAAPFHYYAQQSLIASPTNTTLCNFHTLLNTLKRLHTAIPAYYNPYTARLLYTIIPHTNTPTLCDSQQCNPHTQHTYHTSQHLKHDNFNKLQLPHFAIPKHCNSKRPWLIQLGLAQSNFKFFFLGSRNTLYWWGSLSQKRK